MDLWLNILATLLYMWCVWLTWLEEAVFLLYIHNDSSVDVFYPVLQQTFLNTCKNTDGAAGAVQNTDLLEIEEATS